MRAFLLASAVVATVSASAAFSIQPADSNGGREKMICKSEPRTGTRFGRRSCISKAQRDREAEQARKDAGEYIDRAVASMCSGDRC